jgi:Phosphatidylserine synthase
MLIGKYNKSVIVTYLGVITAILGVYFAFGAQMKFAFVCLIVSGVCDLFDGMVARKIKRTDEEKLFGIEIDSLADMVNFIMLPLVIAFALGLNTWYHLFIYCLYTLAAITRLGYFNIGASENNMEVPVSYYSGLPVTYAALILPLVWLVSFVVASSIFQIIYSVAMLLIALLFVLNIKISKPRGLMYVLLALLAIIVSTIIIIFG